MSACSHGRVRRSQRRSAERLLAWLPLRPYRCTDCGKRVWRYSGDHLHGILILVVFALGAYVLLWWLRSEPLPTAQREVQAPVPMATAVPVVAASQVTPTPIAAEAMAIVAAPPVRQPPRATPLVLHGVDGGVDYAGIYKLRISHSGGEVPPALMLLNAPPRLVLDMPGDWAAVPRTLPGRRELAPGLVQNVRTGRHQGKLRVVVDMVRQARFQHRVIAEEGVIELHIWPAPS